MAHQARGASLIHGGTFAASIEPRDDAPLTSRLQLSLLQYTRRSGGCPVNAAVATLLRRVHRALLADDLPAALRQVDRAFRCQPEDAVVLAPLYGRLLTLEARDDHAALYMLRHAAQFGPDPDAAALVAMLLLRLQHIDDARRQFEAAVAQYCVQPLGLLRTVAGLFLEHPGIGAPGWVGRGPKLELVGELQVGATSHALDIRLDGEAAFTQLLPKQSTDGPAAFSLHSPQLRRAGLIDVGTTTGILLGSGARRPANFGLDGRTSSDGRHVTGWLRVGWLPQRSVALRLEDDRGRHAVVGTQRTALPAWRWPLKIDLRAARIRGACIRVLARLPTREWSPLPDSPLLLEPRLRLDAPKAVTLGRWKKQPRPRRSRGRANAVRLERAAKIDVIIPVYGAREETLACIESVLATTGRAARVVVVDDASEDPALGAALDALAAAQRITLMRHAENQGFVASVNEGLALNPTHDAVLLNSDTRVFGDWLRRLRHAAYRTRNVGTVTPLSNSGSIASYPRPEGLAIEPEMGAALHALAAATHPAMSVDIPVGVGFCLYVRRDCLRDVGHLDAEVFASGYGEESDFCMRARRRGWSHRLAADVFVYHAGGLSFGARRAALLERSQRLLNLRHPGYDAFIASFLERDPVQMLRRRLDEQRLRAFEGRFVLIVTLALAGGVDRFVNERCRELRALGLFPLVLRPTAANETQRCELWTDALDAPSLHFRVPQDLKRLVALLRALDLHSIEIQHFLHLDARVIEAVRKLERPYDVFVHDYAWICPRVTLIGGSGHYCGEPKVSVCKSCVRENGSHFNEAISVPALRARSERWLEGARQIFAPSADTAARLKKYFGGLDVQVRPHAAAIEATPLPRRDAAIKAAVRVALIGAIGDHKGYSILHECARDAQRRRLPLEFVVIGYTQDDAALIKTGTVFITGRYGEVEAPHLLAREQPDVAFMPSVWPETWCYTLDYALSAGLPVAAFDLGAIAERLRQSELGMLLALGMEPPRINDCLLELGLRRRAGGHAGSAYVQTWPADQHEDVKMTERETNEMSVAKTNDNQPKSAQEQAPSAVVQVLPLPPGLYLFSVTAAAAVPPQSPDQLALPAVQVSLGPGVRADQVEFMTGPSMHGAWLYAQGDMLVTKIKGGGATLVMTSMRGPGGDVLAVKVERLEGRAEVVAVDKAAAKMPAANSADAASGDDVPIKIAAHIRTRGDMSFADAPWAGRVAPGLWIESFSVLPLTRFKPQDIEYKGLTGSGFETPWISEDKMCGTKGMAVPLVGFAARLKGTAAGGYDCEYSGYFQSGVTVGPLRNGAPCRSTTANDPLEGIAMRLVKRSVRRQSANRS